MKNILLASMLILAGCASAQPVATPNTNTVGSVPLAWYAPPTNQPISGYQVWVGTSHLAYYTNFVIPNPAATNFNVTNLVLGQTYYFNLTDYNTNNGASPLTTELSCAPLSPVAGLSIP